jgi:hypothetical protein
VFWGRSIIWTALSSDFFPAAGKKARIEVANKTMGTNLARASGDSTSGVVRWRAARLQSAGFEPALAEALARDRRCDIHGLIELAERGCPPQLAARILAPLEDEEQPSR